MSPGQWGDPTDVISIAPGWDVATAGSVGVNQFLSIMEVAMRMLIGLISVLFFFVPQSHAQFHREWLAEYSTSGSPGAIITDNSLNCYVTGSGSSGFTTLKYSSTGALAWTHISGAGLSGDALLLDGAQNLIVGGRHAEGTNVKYYLQKLSPFGSVIWSSPRIGNSQSNTPLRMAMDANGDIIMVGTDPAPNVGRQIVTAKISGSTGAVLWMQTWNHPMYNGHDYGRDLAVDASGNIFVCGSGQRDAFHSDLVVLRYNAADTLLRVVRHDGGGGTADLEAKTISLDGSGNIIVAGYRGASTTTATRNFFTVKYDTGWTKLWEHEYDVTGRQDEAVKVLTDATDNIYVTGVARSNITNDDVLTIKYSPAGSMMWQHLYHSVSNLGDYPTEMKIGRRGYIHVFGYAGQRMTILTYEPGGILRAAYSDTTMDTGHHLAACFDREGNTYMATRAPTSIPRYHTIKLTSNLTNADRAGAPVPEQFELHQNYPNPFNPTTIIRYHVPVDGEVTLAVHDVLGRRAATLADGRHQPGTHEVSFDGTALPSGVYFYTLRAGDVSRTRKLVLMR